MTFLPRLSPLDGEPRNTLHSALDIETWGLNAHEDGSSFAIGDAFDERGHHRFTSRDDMVCWLRSRSNSGRVFWAHNGGRYDYLSLFGNYLKTMRPVMVGGRLIEFRINNARNVTRFRDSMNLFPVALTQIGAKMGYPKGDTPQKFKDADRAAGITEEDWTYLERDCEIVYKAVQQLQDEFGEVRATIPSLAMYHFRRHYLKDTYAIRPEIDDKTRQAYYGGRVEAYYIGKIAKAPLYYDINSLYPYAMITTDFPDPSQLTVIEGAPPEGAGGVVFGTAHVPTTLDPPPLPLRLPDKLLFPVGTFKGAWAMPEYELALSLGVKFEIESAVVAPTIPTPFKSYVETVYGKKESETGFKREMYKLMLNALYGKFGEQHKEQSQYAEHYDAETHAELEANHKRQVTWDPLSTHRADGFYRWGADKSRRARHSVYIWAAYITARARVINYETHHRLAGTGAKVLYTDTDSFMLTDAEAPPDLVGKGLGKLKLESKTVTEIWGAKYYVAKDEDGKETLYLKGVKKGSEPVAFSLDRRPAAYRFRSVVGARESIVRRLPAGAPKWVTRSALTQYQKRVVLPDGWTRAIEV